MKSQASIQTHEAKRIAKRLFNHWKHKFEVHEHDHIFQIDMPDATVILSTSDTRLDISIDTSRDDYPILEKVLLDHLSRMAQQDFQVTWTHELS